jgi:hypothetical protein
MNYGMMTSAIEQTLNQKGIVILEKSKQKCIGFVKLKKDKENQAKQK